YLSILYNETQNILCTIFFPSSKDQARSISNPRSLLQLSYHKKYNARSFSAFPISLRIIHFSLFSLLLRLRWIGQASIHHSPFIIHSLMPSTARRYILPGEPVHQKYRVW